MIPYEESELVEQLRGRDQSAQLALYDRCTDRLKPYFLAKLRDPGEADAYVNEVFVRAMEGLSDGNTEVASLNGWLRGIAANLLKQHYEELRRTRTNHTGDEPPAEIATPEEEPDWELDGGDDLPSTPTDLEFLLGKRELWATMRAAVDCIGQGLRRVFTAHMQLSVREKRKITAAELAAELDMTPARVDRQLNRARGEVLKAIPALVVARTGAARCGDLAAMLEDLLTADQLVAGRALVLNPKQVGKVLGHTTGCDACGERAHDARVLARWALPPALITPEEDDRRRTVIGWLGQARDGRTLVQSSTSALSSTALAARPVIAAAGQPTRQPGRLSALLGSWTSRHEGLRHVTTFVTQNPAVLRVAVGAVVSVAVGLLAVSSQSGTTAEAVDEPVVQTSTTSPGAGATTAFAPSTTPAQPPGPVDSPVTAPNPTAPAATSIPPVVHPTTKSPVTSPQASPSATARPTTATTAPSTTTTTPAGGFVTVAFDVSDTSYPYFFIAGFADQLDRDRVHQVDLARGGHKLRTSSGQEVEFSLDSAGNVSYDSRYDRVLKGKGTRKLSLQGLPVTVDASDTDYPTMGVAGIRGGVPKKHQWKLVPGAYKVSASSGAMQPFKVDDDGHVTYGGGLDRAFGGRGTDRLQVRGLPVTVDASGADYPTTGISGVASVTAKSYTAKLMPGAHAVLSGVVRQFFTVGLTGAVDYDAKYRRVLGGSGSGTLTLHGLPVTFDLRDTSYTMFNLHYVESGNQTTAPRTWRLMPGEHVVAPTTKVLVNFQVGLDGVVGDVGIPGPFAVVRGGNVLEFHGRDVVIDFSGTSYPDYTLLWLGRADKQKVKTWRLIPGLHEMAMNSSVTVQFTVGPAGTVDYDATYQKVLGGRGSDTLTLLGAPVTIDLRDTSYVAVNLLHVESNNKTTAPRTWRLMPGEHTITMTSKVSVRFRVGPDGVVGDVGVPGPLVVVRGGNVLEFHGREVVVDVTGTSYSDYNFLWLGMAGKDKVKTWKLLPGLHELSMTPSAALQFTVGEAGTVDYDVKYGKVLSGSGSATLTLRGLPVTVDLRDTSYTLLNLLHVESNNKTTEPRTWRLMPGEYTITMTSEVSVRFRVGLDGVVGDVSLPGPLAVVRGGNVLEFHGRDVVVDVTGASYPDYGLFWVGQAGQQKVKTWRLLPGLHELAMTSSVKVPFSVGLDGTPTPDPKYAAYLTGHGNTLTVRGKGVTIDATDVSYPTYSLGYVGTVPRTTVKTWYLLPGAHSIGGATATGVAFTLNVDGSLTYPDAVRHIVEKRDATTLVVHGVRIGFDATATSFATFGVHGVKPTMSAREPQHFLLLPGDHLVTTPTGKFHRFTVTPEGKVAFAPELDPVFDGRGTGTLVLRRN